MINKSSFESNFSLWQMLCRKNMRQVSVQAISDPHLGNLLRHPELCLFTILMDNRIVKHERKTNQFKYAHVHSPWTDNSAEEGQEGDRSGVEEVNGVEGEDMYNTFNNR